MGFLVHVGTTQNGELFDLVGQRDRAADRSAGALCRVDDFLCGGIEHPVIERLQANTDVLALSHVHIPYSGMSTDWRMALIAHPHRVLVSTETGRGLAHPEAVPM